MVLECIATNTHGVAMVMFLVVIDKPVLRLVQSTRWTTRAALGEDTRLVPGRNGRGSLRRNRVHGAWYGIQTVALRKGLH